MPTLIDVYAKFGFAAEAAQLLETELGNLLLSEAIGLHGFRKTQNKALAKKILGEIDRKTLGQLIQALKKNQPDEKLQELLALALSERNRLNHSFYRQHNLRRNSEEGRMLMLADLEVIHERILTAYAAASQLADIETAEEALLQAQSGHLPL
ncbi:MAG: hypothetical protein Q8N13_19210 [Acidovorax sp.]|nr:hypothetical protein [Acidovorax sp.]